MVNQTNSRPDRHPQRNKNHGVPTDDHTPSSNDDRVQVRYGRVETKWDRDKGEPDEANLGGAKGMKQIVPRM